MLKNLEVLAGGTGGGVAAALAWYLLETKSFEPAPYLGAWTYGVSLGAGATIVYMLCGGRSLRGTAVSCVVGTALVTCTLLVLLASAYADEPSAGIWGPLVGCAIATFVTVVWIVPLATIFVLAPGVGTALALGGATTLVARLVARART